MKWCAVTSFSLPGRVGAANADQPSRHTAGDVTGPEPLAPRQVGDAADAGLLIARAAAHKRPGPYQLQAAIVACHAEAKRWEDTDRAQITVLYDMLLYLAPSPVTRLHRAVAYRYVAGPQAALSEVDSIADQLDDYHLLHATRAELLRELGRRDEAREADVRALARTTNPAEQSLLQQRLSWR